MIFKFKTATVYIPKSALSINIVVIPVVALIAELIASIMNNAIVKGNIQKEKN